MLKKIGYVVIALLFGSLGIHNLIEKNYSSFAAKFLITVIGFLLFNGWAYAVCQSLVSLWILIDIIYFCITGKEFNL